MRRTPRIRLREVVTLTQAVASDQRRHHTHAPESAANLNAQLDERESRRPNSADAIENCPASLAPRSIYGAVNVLPPLIQLLAERGLAVACTDTQGRNFLNSGIIVEVLPDGVGEPNRGQRIGLVQLRLRRSPNEKTHLLMVCILFRPLLLRHLIAFFVDVALCCLPQPCPDEQEEHCQKDVHLLGKLLLQDARS